MKKFKYSKIISERTYENIKYQLIYEFKESKITAWQRSVNAYSYRVEITGDITVTIKSTNLHTMKKEINTIKTNKVELGFTSPNKEYYSDLNDILPENITSINYDVIPKINGVCSRGYDVKNWTTIFE